ncbi:tRNA (guanosine(46)-N7)-methyltransferase TrmB [Nocardioidaceae bacterium]|nr:tRNA (guanosine(46)-N7)-methyltransferase TrmB [Nocardioidaceae bacterium]
MTKPHAGRTTSARPHTRLTEDGRRVREVLSYSRRGARLTEKQHRAWSRRADEWVVPTESVEDGRVSWSDVFGRKAPLVVEVGSGVGETAAAYAAAHPEHDVLALEVWQPGMAELLHRADEAGAHNVRVLGLDAVWALDHLFEPGSVHELWTFFPDPWPKARHHKRRIVTPAFTGRVATVLRPGGTWRLATDWPPYAEWMTEVIGEEPRLRGGVVERWTERPATKFERRGRAAERPVVDLAYVVEDSRA